MGKEAYWVYMVECDNGSYYTGSTDNVVRRYWQHRQGLSGARFMRAFRPRRMICCWRIHGSRGDALRIENLIKKRDRRFKDDILAQPSLLADLALGLLGVELNYFSGALVEELAISYTKADSRRGFDPIAACGEAEPAAIR
jgi:putative endonuclease